MAAPIQFGGVLFFEWFDADAARRVYVIGVDEGGGIGAGVE